MANRNWCLLVNSDFTLFDKAMPFRVELSDHGDIKDLRDSAKARNSNLLAHVDVSELMVWQLHKPLPLDKLPDELNKDTFLQTPNGTNAEDRANVAKKLMPRTKLDSTQLAKDRLHFLIEVPVPAPGSSVVASSGILNVGAAVPSKRPRVDGDAAQTRRDQPLSNNIKRSKPQERLSAMDPLFIYWKQAWGIPLDPGLTEIPVNAASTSNDPQASMSVDLLPGSPVMTLDTSQGSNEFLVRTEYIRMYDFVNNHFSKGQEKDGLAVVVTGQPGIGKTVWIRYALTRRLAERHPTLYYSGGSFYLFHEDGVKEADSALLRWALNPKDIPWCFIDAESAKRGLPVQVSGSGQTGSHVVYVSSPSSERWKGLDKSKDVVVGVMNPWTWREMDYATRHFDTDKKKAVRDRFDRLGPMARVCFGKPDDWVSKYETQCREAIRKVPNMATLMEKYVVNSRNLEALQEDNTVMLQGLSHKICLVRRQGEAVSDAHHLFFTSDYIAGLCEERLEEAKRS